MIVVAVVAAGCGCRGEERASSRVGTPAAPAAQASAPDARPAAAADAAVDARRSDPDAAASAKAAVELAAARAIDQRLDAADRLAPASLRAAVAKLAPDEQRLLARLGACDGAMVAAELLEKAGDPGFLPRWSPAASPAELTRALCLMAGLERPARRAYLRDFLPPTGEVSVFHEVCPGDRRLVPAGLDSVRRGTVRGDELPHAIRANSPGCVATAPVQRCSFVGDNRDFTFEFQVQAGAHYLASIQSTPLTGCY